jgi:glutamyl-tRNA(Gln) amidotransferase subunit E
MRTPQEVREVVTEIGRLMRITGKVRRGIGSVRQDVNCSITGGSRVEIKGVPQIGWIPRLVHNEALRQKSLLEIKQVLAQRNITENNLGVLKTDLTKILSSTKSEILRNALSKGAVIGGIKIGGVSGILNYQTQPTKTFADEIIGRVRVIACLDVMPNLFHTDNYPVYEGFDNDLVLIKKALKIDKSDAGVIIWGSKQDVETALEEVRLRIIDAMKGVPNETRQPFRSGITDFERILPGPNRMYPDTDSPPTKITAERVEKIKQNLPEVPWKREHRYVELGIPSQVAKELAILGKTSLLDKVLTNKKLNPTLVGIVLTQQLKALRRKGIDVSIISDKNLVELFDLYAKGIFYREAIPIIIEKVSKNSFLSVEDIIVKNNLSVVTERELQDIIDQTIKDNQFKVFKSSKKKLLDKMTNFYIGKVMRKLKGRINGQTLHTYIREKVKNRFEVT